MQAYHGTYFAVSTSIKVSGLTTKPVYITLDLEIAEQYAFTRAKQHNDVPCIITLTLPDSWMATELTPDENSEFDRDAWVVKDCVPASYIASIDKLNAWGK